MIAVAASLLSVPVLGAPLAPTRASSLVTLVAQSGVVTDCPDGGYGFAQQAADGSFAAFTIPAKHVLVVTSIDWERTGTPAQTVTHSFSSQATGSASRIVALANVLSDANGRAGGTLVIPSGTAIEAGRTVCMDAAGLPFAVLHGYLAKDK